MKLSSSRTRASICVLLTVSPLSLKTCSVGDHLRLHLTICARRYQHEAHHDQDVAEHKESMFYPKQPQHQRMVRLLGIVAIHCNTKLCQRLLRPEGLRWRTHFNYISTKSSFCTAPQACVVLNLSPRSAQSFRTKRLMLQSQRERQADSKQSRTRPLHDCGAGFIQSFVEGSKRPPRNFDPAHTTNGRDSTFQKQPFILLQIRS